MKVMVVASLAYSLTNFRGTLLAQMVTAGHEVVACAPDDDASVIADLSAMGVRFSSFPMSRANLNPLEDMRTLAALVKILRREKPDVILAYTQKPIIYAGIAHRILRHGRFFPMVTGLGYVFSDPRRRPWLRRLVARLYRAAVANASRVIVYNADDRDEMLRNAIIDERHHVVLVPGSGVDTVHFSQQPVPDGEMVFLMIARLLHDKGIREFVAAAAIVRRQYPAARFRLLGPFDPNPAAISREELDHWRNEGIVDYLGETRDVRPHLAECSVFVLPSYREGIPRTVLEAMATGRAIVTTDAPGCRETITEGVNGFIVPVREVPPLADAMTRFCRDPGLAANMGESSRATAVKRFSVENVNQILLRTMRLNAEGAETEAPPEAIGESLPQPVRRGFQ